MADLMSLEDFYLTHLSVHWHEPNPPVTDASKYKGTYVIDYDVLIRKGDEHLFALKLRYKLVSANKRKPIGYEIDSEIMGLFRFPESMSKDDMQKLVRFNGTVILYGILRGEVAAFTGAFPGRKFVLPTVDMLEIVKKIESQKNTVVVSSHNKKPKKDKR